MSDRNNTLLQAAHPQDWPRAEIFLPAFLKNTLPASDKAWMEQWINQINNQGGELAAALADEMAWTKLAQEQLAKPAAVLNVEAGWHQLQARLAAEKAAARSAANVEQDSLLSKLHQWINQAFAWWSRPMVGVLASALLVAQMGLLAAVVKQLYGGKEGQTSGYPASGDTRLANAATFRVVFKPQATAAQIQSLLSGLQGQIVGGPSVLGLWTVQVPLDQQRQAIQALKTSSIVESWNQE